MAVYFVYRSHYDTPALNHLRRFDDDSVLAWFRRHWRGVADYGEAARHVKKLLGCHVYGLGSLFHAIAEHSLAAPASDAALKRLLDENLYAEGEIICRPHVVQVLTDDDELEKAYYFFDDHFLAKYDDRAAFLLHEDWALPAGEGGGGFKPGVAVNRLTPSGRGAGATYIAFLAWYDSGNLTDIEGAHCVPGVRLPDLPRYLATAVPPAGYRHEGGWPFEMHLLRSQLLAAPPKAPREEKGLLAGIEEEPAEVARWLIHADWLEEHGQPRNAVLGRALRAAGRYPVGTICNSKDTRPVRGGSPAEARRQLAELVGAEGLGDTRKVKVQADAHVAQLSLPASRGWETWHRWVIFDDLWAGAHPALARAVLRYAGRWDVLS
jgi:uncharacterized protein (TIGR02996 family)